MGTLTGVLLEFPLLRSTKGEIFGRITISSDNPDGVVFIPDGNTATFMGVTSHTGNQHQGNHHCEFIVSGFTIDKVYLVS